MNQAHVNEFKIDPAELPQIRFPIKGAKDANELAGDQDDIEKLSKIVAGSFVAIAGATGLSEKEVLHVIEGIDADMLKDVLKGKSNVDVLKEGIQGAIKNISLATGLDTAQITKIFAAKKNTNLKDIVSRLHESAQASRAKFGLQRS